MRTLISLVGFKAKINQVDICKYIYICLLFLCVHVIPLKELKVVIEIFHMPLTCLWGE